MQRLIERGKLPVNSTIDHLHEYLEHVDQIEKSSTDGLTEDEKQAQFERRQLGRLIERGRLESNATLDDLHQYLKDQTENNNNSTANANNSGLSEEEKQAQFEQRQLQRLVERGKLQEGSTINDLHEYLNHMNTTENSGLTDQQRQAQFEQRQMQRLIERGKLPVGATIDEYKHYLQEQAEENAKKESSKADSLQEIADEMATINQSLIAENINVNLYHTAEYIKTADISNEAKTMIKRYRQLEEKYTKKNENSNVVNDLGVADTQIL